MGFHGGLVRFHGGLMGFHGGLVGFHGDSKGSNQKKVGMLADVSGYTLWSTNITMENNHFSWVNQRTKY